MLGAACGLSIETVWKIGHGGVSAPVPSFGRHAVGRAQRQRTVADPGCERFHPYPSHNDERSLWSGQKRLFRPQQSVFLPVATSSHRRG